MSFIVIKMILLAILSMLSLIDFKRMEIPTSYLWIGQGVVLVAFLYYRPFPIQELLGGVCVGLVLAIVSKMTKEGIGMGDAYVFIVSGTALGFYNNVGLLMISTFVAAVIGLTVVLKREIDLKKPLALPGPVEETEEIVPARISMKEIRLPFVPCILAAYIIMLFI